MAIQKIKKEDINFDKIYGTKYDAQNSQNSVKTNEVYWGDNGDLFVDFDDSTNTGVVTENGVALGYINKDSLKSDSNASKSSMYKGSYRDDSDDMQRQTTISKISQNSMYNGSYRDDNDVMQKTGSVVSNNISYQEETNNETIEDNIINSQIVPEENRVIEEVSLKEETPEEIAPISDFTSNASYEPETNQTYEETNNTNLEPEEVSFDNDLASSPEVVEENNNSDEIEKIVNATDDNTKPLEELSQESIIENDNQNMETPAEETQIEQILPFERIENIEAMEENAPRDIEEINAAVEKFGGNNDHSIFDDAKRSGNEEIYMENMNNLIDGLEGVEKKFNEDGLGYSFQSTVFSGGKHATNIDKPTHLMGAKADLRFYKNGEQLDVHNATQTDWQYIKNVLEKNNLGVQFEKHNTVWGDVFLQNALNQKGETVNYDDGNWGSGTDIHYTK